MADIAKVRTLLQTTQEIAFFLTDAEIQEVFLVYKKALDRMKKESKSGKFKPDS